MKRPWPLWMQYWNALRPCWFAALIVISVCAIVLAAGQMRDILEYSVDRSAQQFGVRWPLVFLYLESALLSITAWYFCRAALYLRYPHTDRAGAADTSRKWVPRWLGIATPIAIGLGFAVRAGALAATDMNAGTLMQEGGLFDQDWFKHVVHALGFFGLALLLLLFYQHRRLVPFFDDKTTAEERYALREQLTRRVWFALAILIAHAFIILGAILIWPVGAPRLVGAGGLVLCAAAAWLAFGTLLIVMSSRMSGPPVILALVLIAAIFSFWNDNHNIKTLPNPEFAADGSPPPDRATFEAHTWRWLVDRRADIRAASLENPYPVVFVAAEGGGIRAAYVAALTLAKLEDLTACAFSEHLFAMAGVSGGSVGVATFVASRANLAETACPELRETNYASRRTRGEGSELNLNPFETQARAFLKQDHLSPTLAGMFFVDLPARFSFLPFPASQLWVDRGWFMEESLIRGWGDVIGRSQGAKPVWSASLEHAHERGDVMGLPITDAIAAAAPVKADGTVMTEPAVVFTTTSVKTGRQWAVSNVRVDRQDWERRRDLLRVLDGSLTLAQSAHMSARFTLISPAATATWRECLVLRAEDDPVRIAVLDTPQSEAENCEESSTNGLVASEKRRDRFVDGGYFENSGASALERMMQVFERVVNVTCRQPGPDETPAELEARTRADLLRILPAPEVADALRLPCVSDRLSLHVIALDADPAVVPEGADPTAFQRAELSELEDALLSDGFLSETTSPVRALFATREERGREAVFDLYVALLARRERFRETRTIDDTREYVSTPRSIARRTARTIDEISMNNNTSVTPRIVAKTAEIRAQRQNNEPRTRSGSVPQADYSAAREVLEKIVRERDRQEAADIYNWQCDEVIRGPDGQIIEEDGWHLIRILVDEDDRDGLRVPLGWLLAASSARTIEGSLARDCDLLRLVETLKPRE